jgi:hypothetical protein
MTVINNAFPPAFTWATPNPISSSTDGDGDNDGSTGSPAAPVSGNRSSGQSSILDLSPAAKAILQSQ